MKKNIYDVFAEHIREHIKNNDASNPGILNDPLSGICPFCEQTMYRVYKNETGQDWKI